ncbi:MAG: glycerol-3-phosphate 1-O-acyltransferase PlsY [Thioalkalispiraceae bacterium]|jgi:glycerol-3-phosphate acyltransferase PlsY
MLILEEILFIVAAYLIGSVSTAIVVCKLMGLPDPRSGGSGNPGATNVLRIGGKKAAAITLFGDMLKGFVPVFVASFFNLSPLAFAFIGFAAFIGHLFPIFFGFKGGKGVATMLGVLFGIHWAVGLASALTWLIMAKVFKISSLSALIATLLAPLYIYLLFGLYLKLDSQQYIPLIISTGAMTAILFYRHRSNIVRLLRGEEDKIGKSS